MSFDEASTSWPVSLVGAGPGDPELLTVRATKRLANADVVLHDRLLDDRVLALLPPDARLIDVGKGPGPTEQERGCSQERINELLVLFALAGHRVVRLKAGDPFVFGRGREEADALDAASFTVVTGSRAPGEPEPDWVALARLGGTIVVLMGVAKRAAIAERLMAGGLAADTPVAAVMEATHRSQHVVTGTLADLGTLAVRNPAVIVIGAVAAFASAGVPAAIAC